MMFEPESDYPVFNQHLKKPKKVNAVGQTLNDYSERHFIPGEKKPNSKLE